MKNQTSEKQALILPNETLTAYNKIRNCEDKSVLCHAPFASMYFNQGGDGIACCYNMKHVFGTFPKDSVHDMWFGQKAEKLREYIRNNDLRGQCAGCFHQLTSGNFHGMAILFDRFARKNDHRMVNHKIDYPRSLEFSLSNVCNLECVMCSGYYSALIRRNREKLPPLKIPYDDSFVGQLVEFIPHLKIAKFFGGEPFLISIYRKIWEKISELNPDCEIHITTNATVLNQKSKELIEKLNCRFILSIDSLERKRYESIRQNASYDEVMKNLTYLQDYSQERGLNLSMAICPMIPNWEEIPQMVQYANANAITVCFNTVYHPIELSFRSLEYGKLEEIVTYWEQFDISENSPLEKANKQCFQGVINQVRQWAKEARTQAQGIETLFDSPDENSSLEPADVVQFIAECLMRHLTFTTSSESKMSINITATYSSKKMRFQKKLIEALSYYSQALEASKFLSCYFQANEQAYLRICSDDSEEEKELYRQKNEALLNLTLSSINSEASIQKLLENAGANIFNWLKGSTLEEVKNVQTPVL